MVREQRDAGATVGAPPGGEKLVKITYNTRACAMAFDEKHAPGFGDFVATQMDRLFADYAVARAQKSRARQA